MKFRILRMKNKITSENEDMVLSDCEFCKMDQVIKEVASDALGSIESGKNSSISEIDEKKTNSITEIDEKRSTAIIEMESKRVSALESIPDSYEELDSKVNSVGRHITGEDLKFYSGRAFGRGALIDDNMKTNLKNASSCPFWFPKGTVLKKNVAKRIFVYGYTGDTSEYEDGFGYYFLWSDTTIGNEFTIPEDGWYVFNCEYMCPDYGIYNPNYTCKEGYAAIYDSIILFDYVIGNDFEPRYQHSIDWNLAGIYTPSTISMDHKYKNGLNKACYMDQGDFCYLQNQSLSSWDARFKVWTGLDTSGTVSQGYASDLLSYKDELWIITTGSDDHSYLTNIIKLKVYENGWVEKLGEINTNLGHINSIRYDETSDTLTWGNGSGDYNLEGEIYIINEFSKCSLATSYSNEIILWDDLVENGIIESKSIPIADYGFKVNFISLGVDYWQALKCVMLTNDGNTIHFCEIPASYVEGKRTYDISNFFVQRTVNIGDVEETTSQSYSHCVQGMDAINRKAVWGVGHGLTWLESYKTTPSSITSKPTLETVNIERVDSIICPHTNKGTRGIAIQNDKLFICNDNIIKSYTLDVIPN